MTKYLGNPVGEKAWDRLGGFLTRMKLATLATQFSMQPLMSFYKVVIICGYSVFCQVRKYLKNSTFFCCVLSVFWIILCMLTYRLNKKGTCIL